MGLKKFKAWVYLLRHVTQHFVMRVFRHASPGLTGFFANYRNDSIFPMSASDRRHMQYYSHCLACRLCDTACPEIAVISPSYIVSAFSRSLTDFRLLPRNFTCGACALCEAACPEHVPIRRLIDFMQTPIVTAFNTTVTDTQRAKQLQGIAQ